MHVTGVSPRLALNASVVMRPARAEARALLNDAHAAARQVVVDEGEELTGKQNVQICRRAGIFHARYGT